MKETTTAADLLVQYGSKSVSDKQLLVKADNTLAAIAKMTLVEISSIKGIGRGKAAAIIAAIEFGRRRQSEAVVEKRFISQSLDMYDLLHPHMRDLAQEQFYVVFLDRRNKIIKTECIHMGGMSAMIVDPKIVFSKALENKANSIILSHNHPSGAASPSIEDIRLTEKIKMAGQYLDIKVLDHIIIGDGSYYSFADEGKL